MAQTQNQNQAKAADLLRMLQESGVGTLAGELEEIVAEAFEEGVTVTASLGLGQTNPYRELGR